MSAIHAYRKLQASSSFSSRWKYRQVGWRFWPANSKRWIHRAIDLISPPKFSCSPPLQRETQFLVAHSFPSVLKDQSIPFLIDDILFFGSCVIYFHGRLTILQSSNSQYSPYMGSTVFRAGGPRVGGLVVWNHYFGNQCISCLPYL